MDSQKCTNSRRTGDVRSGVQPHVKKAFKHKYGSTPGGFTVKQKGIMRHYHRVLKKEQMAAERRPGGSQLSSQICHSIMENKKRIKMTAYQRAQMAYEAKEEEKREKEKEEELRAKERQAALKQYKKNKFRRLQKLTQKTSKGQPVMKGRIQVLLERIQENMAKEAG